MRARTARLVVASALAFALLLAVVPVAQGSFHVIKIRSLFRGPAPTGAFVELQMYADGQNLVGGHNLRVCNSTALLCTDFALPGNVANGQSQRMILIGGSTAPGLPDLVSDSFATTLNNNAAGGALCWDTVDCVSWGTFNGDGLLASPAGTPISGSLSTSMVSVRTIARGCTTALDEPDDTNGSSADFGFAVGYQVRNNASTPTETLCPPPATPVAPTATTPKKKKCKKKKRKKRSAFAAKRCKKKKKKRQRR